MELKYLLYLEIFLSFYVISNAVLEDANINQVTNVFLKERTKVNTDTNYVSKQSKSAIDIGPEYEIENILQEETITNPLDIVEYISSDFDNEYLPEEEEDLQEDPQGSSSVLLDLMHFGNFEVQKNTLRSAYKFIQKYYLPVPRRIDNENCTKVINKFLVNLNTGKESWSLKMGDSWGKIPDGYLFGNIHLMGMYEECLRVEGSIPVSVISNDTIDFTGKYCTIYYNNGNFSLGNIEGHFRRSGPAAAIVLQPIPNHYATCMPSVCYSSDLEMSINETFTDIGINLAKITCTQEPNEEYQFDGLDVFMSFLLSLFSLLVLLGTIAEAILSMNFGQELTRKYLSAKYCFEFLCSFSLHYNIAYLFRYRGNKNRKEITCLRGIRVITLLWILSCHQCEINLRFGVNTQELLKYERPSFAQAITNGYSSVDTFFTLSGLLLGYRLLSSYVAKDGFGFYKLFIRRILRLAPNIFVVALFSATLVRFLGFGPRNQMLKAWSIEQCRPNWWKDPLFIDNYIIGENSGYTLNDCLGHCWYTAVEMQLLLIVPFILYPLSKHFKAGLVWLLVLTLGSIAVPAIVIVVNSFPPIPMVHTTLENHFEFMTKYYLVPWCRASPWFVGFWTGIFLTNRPKNLPRFRTIYAIFGSILAFTCGWVVVFGIEDYNSYSDPIDFPLWLSVVYGALSRPTWALMVSWFILLCHFNNGGVIDCFLSWYGWQILSRLSFAMYLIFPVVQVWWASTLFVPVYLYYLGKMFEVCGVFFITFLVATVLYLFVERPILNLSVGFAARKDFKL